MATTLKLRRGTTAQHSSFTGAAGEVTVDTDKETVVVHDGSTAGGFPLMGTKAPQTLDVNSTSTALRITQLGTGNALLVEDSTNPDATPFVIDADGRLIRGHTSTLATVTSGGTASTPALQNIANAQAGSSVGLFNYSTATSAAYLSFSKGKSGTVGTSGIVASGDNLGSIVFAGDDGTNFLSAAFIRADVDGTPGTDDMPGRLVFSTTADGGSTPTERMRIDSAGNVGIGATAPTTKLEIAGSNNTTWQVTASITGTTMDVTAVTSGTIAVGDLVLNTSVQPYTRVTALGTGTGGIGTYTVSVSQTLVSQTMIGGATYGNTIIRITDTDTSQAGGQPNGALQFYTSDSTAPTAGVGAYVAAVSESTSPDTALVFGTRDNTGGGIDANERMRINSSGNVGIGTSSPVAGARLAVIGGGIQLSGGTTAQEGIRIQRASGYASITGINNDNNTFNPIAFFTSGTEAARIDSSGNVLVTSAAGLGYGTGSGGSVTQATNKTTAVTLNKPTGKITMNAAALASNGTSPFQLLNNLLTATDTLLVNVNFANGYNYQAWAYEFGAGFCYIALKNVSAGSLSEAVVLNFAIIKGATS